MSSGNEQEYTVYKSRRRKTRRKLTPLVVEEHSKENVINSASSVDMEDNTPKAISSIIRMRWHNDMVSIHNKRVKMGLCPPDNVCPPGLCAFPEPSSPVKFFENSTSTRLFQIAQQHPPEYIPVPMLRPYMVPLYPDKDFYEGNGFIPSQFLVQTDH